MSSNTTRVFPDNMLLRIHEPGLLAENLKLKNENKKLKRALAYYKAAETRYKNK